MSEAKARKRSMIWSVVSVVAVVLGAAMVGLDIPGEWFVLGGGFSAGMEASSWSGWIKGHRAAITEIAEGSEHERAHR